MQGDGTWICVSGCKRLRWEVFWPSHLQCIKKISLEYYPNDEKKFILICWSNGQRDWFQKFKLTKAESDASKAKLLEFVKTLTHETKNKYLVEALRFYGGISNDMSIGHISWTST